ncbi:PaaI family thioesterase [candidate division KSB1 bacterium]|nr:PaaI family thioesterase [candidate division KSB1 bacterium]
MSWYNDPDNSQIVGEVTVPEYFNGFPGVVHGGIVAAILDETAGRVVLVDNPDNLMVTMKLEVTYRLPTPTDTPLKAIGRVIRETSKRAISEAELQKPDGTITATAKAVVIKPPQEVQETWLPEKKHWKVVE